MTTKPKEVAPIRLAMRVEGDWWVAYIAQASTMDEALEIGRIHGRFMSAVVDGQERFKTLMADCLRACLTDIGHPPIRMEERPAPQSERSGRG